MIRQEQIYNAAETNIDSFEAGAKWVDSHPDWYKYPDDTPPMNTLLLCQTTKYKYVVLKRVVYKTIDGKIKDCGWNDTRYGDNIRAWKVIYPPRF